ncbi:hypothetical protein [Simiduia agarivorans]|uniref:Uncharacterized protein n=1 Tax=Simiduia agarivorans (strain DSM 21679 / JCM 13881 / BCRC 17597 / SA1) TaxID=1117647 RepID=K4KP84_SIMAS|nr:hypothetical protein [Simiduia agarivorans]AFU99928.1 hypothetical protein M5M_13950 [Simiduia agarivorans SA1 = DSM 21679]
MKKVVFLTILLIGNTSFAEGNDSEFIGDATMLEDGTVVINLVASNSDAEPTVGHSQLIYKTTDLEYENILKHIGGLKVGQNKLVPKWQQ